MKTMAEKLRSQVKSLRNDIALKKSKAKVSTSEAEAQTDMPNIETKHLKVQENEVLEITTEDDEASYHQQENGEAEAAQV